jgi:D-alanyl-D-alanine carboxypeptidase
MKKKIVIILGSLLLLAILIFSVAFVLVKPSKDRVLDFMKENPDRFAISLSHNKSVIAKYNSQDKLPLASTLKTIIAIEYAYQSANGKIDPNRQIPLSELEKYHYPLTDGGAHKNWINSLNLKNDSTSSIQEIAKGMIKFSSNANTEYLSDLLGIYHINHRIKELDIQTHDSIYYLVSSLFVKDELYSNLEDSSALQALKSLSSQKYISATQHIHSQLKNGRFEQDSLNNFGLEAQKIWSDRLPGSTARDYRMLMEKLNSKSELPKEVHQHLDPVLEFIMENPQNQSWLKHSGAKGGSTASLLTKALYATRENGDRIALAYFLTDLSTLEQIQLSMSMNAFEIAILQDAEFRNKIKKTINQL